MKIIRCTQGSSDWHAARAGVCTASMFKVARKTLKSGPNKGQPGEDTLNYAFRLAVERISGQALADDKFETYAMRRGHELEPEARATHEEQAGVIVERAGFVTTDDDLFGASVDGTISHDGASEYKCLVSPEGLRDVLLSADLSEFQDQMQGGLWITGRKYFHFGLYCPALRPIGRHFTMHVVERDDNYIEPLEVDLMRFNSLVNDFEAKLRNGAANSSVLQQAA